MRQALLAALALVPLSALAEIEAAFDPASGTIAVSGLAPDAHARILADPDRLRLRVAGLDTKRPMLASFARHDGRIVVTPRFPLRAGLDYVLDLGPHRLVVALPAPEAKRPTLTAFAPAQAVIPANTLRLYLQFSEPMARGRLRETVTLLRGDGTEVNSPFLTLEAELWDPSQTRATLLLDPGRIKQGVGPNVEAGAPLDPGENYRLIVSGRMESAKGVPLGTEAAMTFRAGPAERRAIDPGSWRILTPKPGGHAPLAIAFDRIMDGAALPRRLTLQDPRDRIVRGRVTTDGGGWSLTPEDPWQFGTYRLVVDPALEDVSGNTLGAPFDADRGTIATERAPALLEIEIAAH
ncbi:MAG: Ig-like domain-containing protein [Pseudomonadota bacterium]